MAASGRTSLGNICTLFLFFCRDHMQASFKCLIVDVAEAVKYFQESPGARAMPFMHSFPKNACERSAGLLALALATKYENDRVICVKGRDPNNGDMHFWLEIADLVVDPTAHQFVEFAGPLVCAKPSPLEKKFPRFEESSPLHFSTYLAGNSNGLWCETLRGLCIAIHA